MKRIVRILLLLAGVALLYMLFLSIREGMRAMDAEEKTKTEQTHENRNS